MEEKKELRGRIKKILEEKVLHERASSVGLSLEKLSYNCAMNVMKLNEYNSFDVLFAYMAMNTELDVQIIIKDFLARNKTVALPRMLGTDDNGAGIMDFYTMPHDLYSENRYLVKGRWGILEPISSLQAFEMKENTSILVLVPGLAFSYSKGRVGHGKGYYDLFLQRLKKEALNKNSIVKLVGICYDEQLLFDELPMEKHDVFMDVVVSPSKIIR